MTYMIGYWVTDNGDDYFVCTARFSNIDDANAYTNAKRQEQPDFTWVKVQTFNI